MLVPVSGRVDWMIQSHILPNRCIDQKEKLPNQLTHFTGKTNEANQATIAKLVLVSRRVNWMIQIHFHVLPSNHCID